MAFVSTSTPMPDKATRERAAEATKRSQGGLEVIVRTSGGRPQPARAVLTGISLFSGKIDEHHVVTDLDEAARIVAAACATARRRRRRRRRFRRCCRRR